MRPVYFDRPAELRRWFAANHRKATELWIGFRKVGSGLPSVTYPEALDEALCVGWIDGLRRSVDATRYAQRFTPRRKGSIWSLVNIRKVEALIASGRMKQPGLDAFARRNAGRQRRYSYENTARGLPAAYERRFRADRAAWAFFDAQAPWYRRTASFWVMSAVKDETRERRLAILMADSAAGQRLAALSNRRVGQKKR